MKQGTTTTFKVKEFDLPDITEIIFSFTNDKNNVVVERTTPTTDDGQIHKSYPSEVTLEDGFYKIGFSQEETLKLNETFYVEAQIMFSGAVTKAYIDKVRMPHTFYTKVISGAETNGEEIELEMEVADLIEIHGGTGTDNYNDLDNKPQINSVTLQGNKTSSQLGLQPTISGGNGISVSSDTVSVALKNGETILGFDNGKLASDLSAYYTKTEIDQMISADLKFEVVQTLPQTPDTHTIYLVPKSTSETNNVYDEYMYINNAWELIGTTEVDLSNYYTKTESDNRYYQKYETYAKNEINSRLATKVDKVETQATVTIPTNSSTTSDIDVTDYAVFKFVSASGGSVAQAYNVRAELLNGQTIVGYKDIYNSTSQEFVDIDLSYATSLKLQNLSGSASAFDLTYQLTNEVVRERELTTKLADKQAKLTAGTNITIDSNNVISASGGGSYSGGDGIDITNDTISVDIASGSALQITSGELDVDLSSKQDVIDSTHKLSADNVDDTNTTNKFTNATEKQTWNAKADNTTITTDTSSTTVSLTLADNNEYRYTADLTSLTLTMPSGNFIASVVFASGSTPTSMTYDSNIKWSGDDVTSNAFVPVANKTYDVMFYYNGLNVNGIVRGVS